MNFILNVLKPAENGQVSTDTTPCIGLYTNLLGIRSKFRNKSVANKIWSSKNLPISFSTAGDSWDVCSVDLIAVKPLESTVLLEEQGLFGGEGGRDAGCSEQTNILTNDDCVVSNPSSPSSMWQ